MVAKTSDGTLTEEETRFWKENLWVPDKDLPEFPESKMLTFNETSPVSELLKQFNYVDNFSNNLMSAPVNGNVFQLFRLNIV